MWEKLKFWKIRPDKLTRLKKNDPVSELKRLKSIKSRQLGARLRKLRERQDAIKIQEEIAELEDAVSDAEAAFEEDDEPEERTRFDADSMMEQVFAKLITGEIPLQKKGQSPTPGAQDPLKYQKEEPVLSEQEVLVIAEIIKKKLGKDQDSIVERIEQLTDQDVLNVRKALVA